MSEQYNGWANRETWAFWLHVNNDQGFQSYVAEYVESSLTEYDNPGAESNPFTRSDYDLGKAVVEYVEEAMDEDFFTLDYERMFRNDVGSFWRIDYAEIGRAARELVDEQGE